MLTNTSLNKVLTKARSHVINGEDEEAKKALPNNLTRFFSQARKIKQELSSLKSINKNNNPEISLKDEIHQLTQLYNQGKYTLLIEKALTFTKKNPQAWMIWNILGATYLQLKKTESALKLLAK